MRKILIKMARWGLCLFFIFHLTGCSTVFYTVSVNDQSMSTTVKLQSGSVPVKVKLFGCDNASHKLYVDSQKQLWLYCRGYYQGSYTQFAKAGPLPDMTSFDSRSSGGRAIDHMRSNMKEIPLRKCQQNRWCGEIRSLAIDDLVVYVESGGNTYLEYVNYPTALADLEKYYNALGGHENDVNSTASALTPVLSKFFDQDRAAHMIMKVENKDLLNRSQTLATHLGISSMPMVKNAFEQRFVELNYDDAFRNANTATELIAFITLYKNYDPRDLVAQANIRLASSYRSENTAIGFAKAFGISRSKSDFNALQRSVKNRADQTLLADTVMTLARNKEAFFNLSFSFHNAQTKTREKQNMGLFSHYEMYGERKISGTGKISPAAKSPLLHSNGKYKIVLTAELKIDRTKKVRSRILGDSDGKSDYSRTKDIEFLLAPPYLSEFSIDFGALEMIYFDRGSQGGYTAIWPTLDPAMVIRVKSIEPVSN